MFVKNKGYIIIIITKTILFEIFFFHSNFIYGQIYIRPYIIIFIGYNIEIVHAHKETF